MFEALKTHAEVPLVSYINWSLKLIRVSETHDKTLTVQVTYTVFN
jgi:hypothetical protein